MLTVISPAKKLDFSSDLSLDGLSTTQPGFLDQAQQLVAQLRDFDPPALARLMKISDKLASLNTARFAEWHRPFTPDNARPAVFAFRGDVYTGLDADSLTHQDLDEAQRSLRILSGLYGILRPLDLMQAYRLEMGTRLENARGPDLYAFWGDRITAALNVELRQEENPTLVNLASNEYFRSIHAEKLEARLVTPVFKDWKNGTYKVISFNAKKARGLMSRFIIGERLRHPEDLKHFDGRGYRYSAADSDQQHWVFLRD